MSKVYVLKKIIDVCVKVSKISMLKKVTKIFFY